MVLIMWLMNLCITHIICWKVLKTAINRIYQKEPVCYIFGVLFDTIKELQYMAGGMVIFLEAENEEKLIEFYEKKGFKRFSTKEVNSGTTDVHTLIQLLKVL